MFKPKTTISGRLGYSSGEWISYLDGIQTTKTKNRPFERFTLSSGEWIRTTDLRVMSDFPDFGTFFTQALHFSRA